MARKSQQPTTYHLVTITGPNSLKTVSMSEPELIAWLANNEETDRAIFAGTQFLPNIEVTLQPCDEPTQQPIERKKTKKDGTPRAKPGRKPRVNGAADLLDGGKVVKHGEVRPDEHMKPANGAKEANQ